MNIALKRKYQRPKGTCRVCGRSGLWVIDGACGPIVAVQFDKYPGQTFDLFWRKVRGV